MKFLNHASFFLLVLLAPFSLYGATVSFVSPANTFSLQEEFLLTVDIDTEGVSLNALEGELVYPKDLLELKEIRDGDSVINFWVERPSLKEDKLKFSGIIPGGYVSPKGHIFTLIFRTKAEGKGGIELQNAFAIENNQEVTQIKVKAKEFTFVISPTSAEEKSVASIVDNDPPEKFDVSILSAEDIYDGKAFLVFASQDKGSGLNHYEVKEGLFSAYTKAESPYLLEDQNLDKKIFVKAVDNNGNERVTAAYPEHYKPWYKNYASLLIVMLLAVTFYLLKGYLLKTRSAK